MFRMILQIDMTAVSLNACGSRNKSVTENKLHAMHITKNYGDTDFVTGLRAIAATMVVMVHTGALADFGTLGVRISGAGAAGVQAFFVISGFSIATVLAARPVFWDFFVRRLVRIVPLYYAALLLAFILTLISLPMSGWRETLGAPNPFLGLILDFMFLGWLSPQTANDFIGVEWSIPIEVFWYIILAGLLPLLRRRRDWGYAFIGLLLLAGVSRAFSEIIFGRSLWAAWAPTTYGAWFVLGAMTCRLRPLMRTASKLLRTNILLLAALSFVMGLMTDIGLTSAFIGFSTFLVIVGHPGSLACRDPLSSRPMRFLGTISYGIYLWHMFVISLVGQLNITSQLFFFICVYALTICVSIMAYLIVERPAIRAHSSYASYQSN